MAETITKTIVLSNEQEVEVTRVIDDFYVSESRNIVKIRVFNLYNDKNVKTEFYQFPLDEVKNNNTTGDTFYNEIRDKLWEKIKEIDSMPENTEEEIKAKAEKYGNGWMLKE